VADVKEEVTLAGYIGSFFYTAPSKKDEITRQVEQRRFLKHD
jgi:hypothetical protein